MAQYSNLKAYIEEKIYENGTQAITGDILQDVLKVMTDDLGEFYQTGGVALPSTDPGTPDAKVIYFATEAGTYTNFGGITLAAGEVALLIFETSWTKETLNVLSSANGGVKTANLADGAVTTEKIAGGAVETAKIANNAVTSGKVADGAIGTAKIADGAIDADKIAANAVESAKIKNGAVTEGKINDGAVTAGKIASNAVTTDKIKDDAVTSDKIANNAVGNDQIASGAVHAGNIADGAVTAPKIGGGAVTSGKIGSGAVTEEKIADGAVTSDKIANGAVGSDQLAEGAFSAQNLADGSVTTDKLADDAVTAEKIADGAVTAGKFADGSVTTIKLGSGAVTTEKIGDGMVTRQKLADSSVGTSKIIDGAVTTDKVADGAITDAKLENPVSVSQNTLTIGGEYAGEMGDVYDVTLHNNNATFASLEALLSDENLSTLIPLAVRKGGMSIKFVQSSDNKYVEYFLTKNTWSASEADWEKVNLEEEVSQLDQKLIKLVGWDGEISRVNITGAGQYYYNSYSHRIWKCKTWNGSVASSVFVEIYPQESALYQFDGRLYIWNGTELILAASKIITLTGFVITQGSINVGETYYNTSAKEVRRKTAQYDYQVVPFYDSTLYLYNNEIYVWNGSDMVKRGAEIVDNFNSSSSNKALSARCGQVLNETKANLKTVNIFNKDKTQLVGKYIGGDGTIGNDANSIASYLIEIKPNTLYSWQGGTVPYGYNIRCVKADGTTFLQVLDSNGDELTYRGMHYGLIRMPSEAKYFQFTIKFTTNENIADSICLIESDEVVTDYYPYENVIPMQELPQIIKQLPDRVSALENERGKMYGKNMYFCGSSTMNGVLVPAEKRLYNQIATLSGGIAHNLSLDGALFVYPRQVQRESILWQVMQIPQDADYIILSGGTNGVNYHNPDAPNYYPIGEMTNSYNSTFDTSTQIGCLEQMCKYLYENFPGRKIGFIVQYQIEDSYQGYVNYWKAKLEYFLPVLEKWGIPILDWRKSGINLAANAVHYGIDGYANYDDFSESESYNTDDRVIHDNKLYKANEPINAGPWDSTQWTLISSSRYDTWHCNELAYTMLAEITYEWMKTL